jgi:HSP20 family molecular chaperone IbpA
MLSPFMWPRLVSSRIHHRLPSALAGFSPDEIRITAQQNRLTVAGSKTEPISRDQ